MKLQRLLPVWIPMEEFFFLSEKSLLPWLIAIHLFGCQILCTGSASYQGIRLDFQRYQTQDQMAQLSTARKQESKEAIEDNVSCTLERELCGTWERNKAAHRWVGFANNRCQESFGETEGTKTSRLPHYIVYVVCCVHHLTKSHKDDEIT